MLADTCASIVARKKPPVGKVCVPAGQLQVTIEPPPEIVADGSAVSAWNPPGN
jgi:hypothetical protein